ncbi:glycosyltransferase [Rhodoblastus acidophilus]|uniref:Glycosyltransferase n=1 Tax=Candidatus Rhodoblastus alkanivorans TaxID=2954117 RepID=A0ABS9ZAR3_9HYPH|nr:glycosyltransferase family 2 protein [Candidatus Rhodoblastus alkanivorans]MCI4677207.1 glycosyltransferase [Candidatus Rhodoblastus alkanivorans]MCI4684560.1 glycosyltransferase [Candidatus Rhodoblastus alkanivorans]MDI4641881.1 glycosyltransferase [Rhodoblastus acidophilus]
MNPGPLYRSGRSFEADGAEDWPPEIAFLAAEGVGVKALNHAARRARAQGAGADEVLIAEGLIEESLYYRALARRLNCAYVERAAALAPGFDYRAALRASVARADPGRENFDWLMAPRGRDVRKLLALGSGAARRVAICAPAIFSALVRAKGRRALSDDASYALSRADSRLSANAPQLRWSNRLTMLFSLVVLAGLFALSSELLVFASSFLSALFLGGIYVRLCALAASRTPTSPPPPPLCDRDLPTFTIVAPMYREAGVAAQFLRAIRALDYPCAKLDLKIVVEPDDPGTAQALRAAGLPPYAEIVVAPRGAPRTKPRALNVALPLARGRLLTILDAEDRPEPGQLRAAAAAFAVAGPRVACFQARLAIDNGHESWLSYFFAIGYAALFDVINPGLAALGLPLPLGGTSNHFRTDILRRVVGWDAWNVTEDADLGLRFARLGYEVGVIAATTYEDAPTDIASWLGQRSRWMKGWMQTLAVFLRTPRKHVRKIGLIQSFSALSAMSSLIAGPLFGPFYSARFARDLIYGDLLAPANATRLFFAALNLSVGLFGLAALIAPMALGMKRRGLKASPLLLLAPFYLLLLSAAAWRALWEWTRRPFVWTKTEHTPRPAQTDAGAKNFPARASAIKARALSTP